MAETRRHLIVGLAALTTASAVLGAPGLAGAAEPAAPGEQTVAIGGAITMSGGGCLLDGKPGNVVFGLVLAGEPERIAYFGPTPLAGAGGSWTITTTIAAIWGYDAGRPRHPAQAGTYPTVFTCFDPQDVTGRLVVQGDTQVVHVTDPSAPPPSTAAPELDDPGVAASPPAPPAPPTPVRISPRFTG